jgi:enamine deaminase RidA (YjgF/YER057c/UK114 family)
MRHLTFMLLLCFPSGVQAQLDIRHIDPDEKTGTSLAVVVGDVPLVHTSQVLPLDKKGNLVGKDRPAEQIAKVLDNLSMLVRLVSPEPERVVKLNVNAARATVVDEVKKALAERFRGKAKPAVSFVVGALPHADALVAMDAVAARHKFLDGSALDLGGDLRVVFPQAGPRIYIAGQAEKGDDLMGATRRTLESLRATLRFLGLSGEHVVQIKAFMTPMSRVAAVKNEIARHLGSVTPIVFVEWKSSLPIEIELIVVAPRPKEKSAEAIDFLTPPGMTASPIYSRVARINHGKTIYVSGLYGMKAKDATGEIEEIFATLDGVLKKAGSDFHHLAKATYYVSTDEASRKLNELRPKFYDPKRPPAASKAMVPGVGVEGRTITLDMIAVTK